MEIYSILKDPNRKRDLSFFVDICKKLNQLKVELHMRKLICSGYGK